MLLLLFAALFAADPARGTTVQIEPKTEECYAFAAQRGESLTATWSVTRGGLLDIGVSVQGPAAPQPLFQTLHFEGRERGEFSWTADAEGEHRVCFDNTMSRFTAKVVAFAVAGSSEAGAHAGYDEVLTQEDITPVEKTVQRLDSTLMELLQMQRTYRKREQQNRATAESTNTRVLWYSVLVCAVTVVMTLLQVFTLKHWFAPK